MRPRARTIVGLAAALVPVLGVLRPMAFAGPPDPTWLGGPSCRLRAPPAA
jgi:hypothetical protein